MRSSLLFYTSAKSFGYLDGGKITYESRNSNYDFSQTYKIVDADSRANALVFGFRF